MLVFPTLSPTLTNGLSFYIDSRDYIWIIKVSSVLRININRPEESEIYFRKNFQTTVVTETASGDIFIGSRGAGLFRFDEETGAFANFCAGNGDLPRFIDSITPFPGWKSVTPLSVRIIRLP